MSELKARTAQSIAQEEVMLELGAPDGIEPELVYLKSEADKVIADLEESHKKEVGQLMIEIVELKAQKAQAEDDCAYWEFKAHRERHNKHKLCLAMAKWCEMSARENDTRMCLPEKQKFTKHEEYLYFIGYYHKWHRRWLELAKKFKEAK